MYNSLFLLVARAAAEWQLTLSIHAAPPAEKKLSGYRRDLDGRRKTGSPASLSTKDAGFRALPDGERS
jgi:hypothetical protein